MPVIFWLAAIDFVKIGASGPPFRRRGAAHHGERRTGAGAVGIFDRQRRKESG